MTSALLYSGQDLPARIQRAIARVMDPAFPIEMTAAEKVAMCALLRRVEARDSGRAFWVLRANMAELFGRVTRTVTNWLNSLEQLGLIDREQKRTGWGKFSCVTLHLTETATNLLGLADSQPVKKISAGHKVLTDLQSYQRQPSGFNAVDKLSRVPADCQALLKFGLRESAVFRLMKIASQAGKRLGTIIQSKIDEIAKASKPYGYVLLLIKAPSSTSASKPGTPSKKARKMALQAFKASMHGKSIKLDDGTYVRCHADDALSVYSSCEGNAAFVRPIVGTELIRFWDERFALHQSSP